MNARPRIAFLTGQSDPGRCALSPAQRAFLDALELPEAIERVPCNFPWDERTPPWRPVPLLRASLANGRQYLVARRGGFVHLPHEAVRDARESLSRAPRTLLLVGSCGLSLLDALLAHRPDDTPAAMRASEDDSATLRPRLRIVAYGAVAARWPTGIDGQHLRGRRDWVAACGAPRAAPPPQWVDCGHMDYLDQPALRALVEAHRDWLLDGVDTHVRTQASIAPTMTSPPIKVGTDEAAA